MEIWIREAEYHDYEAIYLLNKDSLGYDFDMKRTAERLRYILTCKEYKILVAEIDRRIVGYVHASGYECVYSESLKNIMALAVDRNCRKAGVGRRLMTAVEEWARADGAVGVRLVSGFNREEAHQFYRACGYVDRKDQKNFVKVWG